MKKILSLIVVMLVVLGHSVAMAQGVIISVKKKGQPGMPLPPYAAAYLSNPAQFFNVSMTNPTDESMQVYMGVRLEQLKTFGDAEVIPDIYTPTDLQPGPSYQQSVLTLIPSTTKMLNSIQINNLFAFYPPSAITGLEGVVNKLDGNAVGLLPEGTYRVTLSAYRMGTGEMVSNPSTGACEFDIRYKASGPRLTSVGNNKAVNHDLNPNLPAMAVAGYTDNIVDMDFIDESNTFVWDGVKYSTGGGGADIKKGVDCTYTLEIWRLDPTMDYSLDELPTRSGMKMSFSAENKLTLNMAMQKGKEAWFLPDRFYACRVVAKPKVISSSAEGYSLIDNNGAGPWQLLYNTSDAEAGDAGGSTATVDGGDVNPADNWRVTMHYPKLTSPDNQGNGFTRQMITADNDGNIKVTWDKPVLADLRDGLPENEELYKSIEWAYDLAIYQVPEDESDLEKVMKQEPKFIKKDIKSSNKEKGNCEHTLKWDKDIEPFFELQKNYILVVMPKVVKSIPELKEGELCWTGAGDNCFTFAIYLTAARKFEACGGNVVVFGENADDKLNKGWHWKRVPDKVGRPDTIPTFYVGNTDIGKAFKLRFQEGVKREGTGREQMKDTDVSKFSGDAVVEWNPTVFGKKLYVKILCTLKDAEFNEKGQMVGGTCRSKERTDVDWIPYNLINYTRYKYDDYQAGLHKGEPEKEKNWFEKQAESAGKAIENTAKGLAKKAMSPDMLKSLCGTYYDRIMNDGQAISNVYSLADAFFETDLKSNPITLPLRMHPKMTELIHTDISVMTMEFTPGGASMNSTMLFNMPEGDKFSPTDDRQMKWDSWLEANPDSLLNAAGVMLEGDSLTERTEALKAAFDAKYDSVYVALFGGKEGEEKYALKDSMTYTKVLAFNVLDMCIEQGSLWANSGTAALAYDIDIHDYKHDFQFSFKAPKDSVNIKSVDDMQGGCALHWDNTGDKFSFALSLAGEFTVPKIKAKDGQGKCKAGFGVTIEDWSNFTMTFNMDPFTVDDAPGFVFCPAGGVVWDHSETFNVDGVKFPDKFAGNVGYDWKKWGMESSTLEKKPTLWQGLYIKELSVEFPGGISIAQDYEKGEEDEASREKTTYTSSERKFAVSVEDLIIDRTGVTLCGKLKNLFEAKTARLGGWGMSLDDVHFNVIQNSFRGCGFSGKIKLPLLKGNIKYLCDIEIQSKAELDKTTRMYSARTEQNTYKPKDKVAHLVFKTQPADSLNLDFILGKALFDPKGSWISVNHLPGYGTDVEFMCSGTISLGSDNAKEEHKSSIALPFSFEGFRFVGMRVANFSMKSKGTLPGVEKEDQDKLHDRAASFAASWVKGLSEEDSGNLKKLCGNSLNQLVHPDRKDSASWVNSMAESLRKHEVEIKSKQKDGTVTGLYFNIGDWSFASPPKTLWGWDFTIANFKVGTDNYDKDGNPLATNEHVFTFGIAGKVSISKKGKKTTTTATYDKETDTSTITTKEEYVAGNAQQNNDVTINDANNTSSVETIEGGGSLAATIGITLRSKIYLDTSKGFENALDNIDISYDGCRFDSLRVDGSFGGGMVKVKGALHVRTDSIKGFDGNMTLTLWDIDFMLAGGYYDVKKTAEEMEATSWDTYRYYPDALNNPDVYELRVNERYKAWYIFAGVDGKNKGIPIPGTGITLTSVMGGFYYNYSLPGIDGTDYDKFITALTDTPKPTFGASAFAFGLGLKWGESAAEVNGKFTMLVAYDAMEDRLATFRLTGNIKALKGEVTANVSIIYKEEGKKKDPDYLKDFEITCTIDAKADITDVLTEFVGADNLKKMQEFTEKAGKSGLGDMCSGSDDKGKSGSDDGEGTNSKGEASEADAKKAADKANKDMGGDGGFKANMSAKITLTIKVSSYPNRVVDPDTGKKGKVDWYVRIGEPELEKRCSVTLLDLTFGKGDYKIWAKVYANAYLCFGNVLPDNGNLPDLPKALADFLDGDVEGGGDTQVTKDKGQLGKIMEQRQQAVKDMINNGVAGECNGGVMFGAQAGADFGARFGIGFVELGGLIGFDMALKMMKDDCKCLDEKGNIRPIGGKGGAYAQGQIYTYVYGKAGLILNLGFWSGDIDLMDMKLGAVLKGGFPNPTWGYGKLRVQGNIMHGLIKFNKKIEMKMGKVCMPLVGNPLDNVDIFSETSIGEDNETEGWDEENAVETYSPVTFTTNMAIGQILDLFDEDKFNSRMDIDDEDEEKARRMMGSCTRSFKFYVDPRMYFKVNGKQDLEGFLTKPGYTSTNFELLTGQLEPESQYELTLRGTCKELIRNEDGSRVEADPYIRDLELGKTVQRPWGDTKKIYFCTKPRSEDIAAQTRLIGPYDEEARREDVLNPYLCLTNETPNFEKEGIEVMADLEEVVYAEAPSGSNAGQQYVKHYILPDQLYSTDGRFTRLTTSPSRYQDHRFRQRVEKGVDEKGNPYKYITVQPYNKAAIQALPIEEGKQYRWIFYEMNTATLDKLTSKVEETYKRMKTGDEDALNDLMRNEELNQLIADAQSNQGEEGSNSMAELLNEMMSGNVEMDQMEQRVNMFTAGAYSQGSLFRRDLLAFEVKCVNRKTMAEEAQEGKFQFNTQRYVRSMFTGDDHELAFGGTWMRPVRLMPVDTVTFLPKNSPYHRLYLWHQSMYHGANPKGNASSYATWYAGMADGCDYQEDGETMRLTWKGGFRKLQAVDADYDPLNTNNAGYHSGEIDLSDPAYEKLNFVELEELLMPGGDGKWRQGWGTNTKVSNASVGNFHSTGNSPVGFGVQDELERTFGSHSVTTMNLYDITQNEVKKAYIDDAKAMEDFEKDVVTVCPVKESVISWFDEIPVDADYFTKRTKEYSNGKLIRTYSFYDNYAYDLSESQCKVFRTAGGIIYPEWQVRAMYMTDRWHLANKHTSKAKESWLRPRRYAGSVWDSNLKGYAVTYQEHDELLHPDFYRYLLGMDGFKFDKNEAAKYLSSMTYQVQRPNRYNAERPTVADFDNMANYHVTQDEREARVFTLEFEFFNGTLKTDAPTVTAGSSNNAIQFFDKGVEEMARKALKSTVAKPMTITPSSVQSGSTNDAPQMELNNAASAMLNGNALSGNSLSRLLQSSSFTSAVQNAVNYDAQSQTPNAMQEQGTAAIRGGVMYASQLAWGDLSRITELVYDSNVDERVLTLDDLEKFPNLETFVWDRYDDMPRADFSMNPKLKTLKVLKTVNMNVNLATCPNLETLVIKSGTISSHEWNWYWSEEYRNGYEMSGTYNASDYIVMPSIDLSKCQNLKTLVINHTTLRDIDLRNNGKLEAIDISDNAIGTDCYNRDEYYNFDFTKQVNVFPVFDSQGLADSKNYVNKYYTSDEQWLNRYIKDANERERWKLGYGRYVTVSLTDSEMERYLRDRGAGVYGRDADDQTYSFVTNIYNEKDGALPQTNFCKNTKLNGLDENLVISLYSQYGHERSHATTSEKNPAKVDYWYGRMTIDLADLDTVTVLDCSGYGIRSLANLQEYMPRLKYINCAGNELKSVDLRGFQSLVGLDCSDNDLVELLTSNVNSGMLWLKCSHNELRALELKYMPNLVRLDCSVNRLGQVETYKVPKLQTLICNDNALGDLDIRSNTALTDLECSGNSFQLAGSPFGLSLHMNYDGSNHLERLSARGITRQEWTRSDLSALPRLRELDLSRNGTLAEFKFNANVLRRLDVSHNPLSYLSTQKMKDTQLGSDQYLAGTQAVLEELYASNTMLFDPTTFVGSTFYLTANSQLRVLDLSECRGLNHVQLPELGEGASYPLQELYVGQAIRDSESRIGVYFTASTDGLMTRWDNTLRYDKRNANTYGCKRTSETTEAEYERQREEMTHDVFSEDDKRLMEALGDSLYNRLRLQYCPDKPYLQGTALSHIDVLDTRGMGITVHDLDVVQQKLPNLKRLHLEQSTFDKNLCNLTLYYDTIDICNPYDPSEPITFKFLKRSERGNSLLRIKRFNVDNIQCPDIDDYHTIDMTGCYFGEEAQHFWAMKSVFASAIVLDSTNVQSVRLVCPDVSLSECPELKDIFWSLLSVPTNFKLMQSYPNGNPRIWTTLLSRLKTWRKSGMKKYPQYNFEYGFTLKDGNKGYAVVQPVKDENFDRYFNAATAKAANLTSAQWQALAQKANTPEQERYIHNLFPNEERYLAVWESEGKRPSGIAYDEMGTWYNVDITGANIEDYSTVLAPFSSLHTLSARQNTVKTDSLFIPANACKYLNRLDLTGSRRLRAVGFGGDVSTTAAAQGMAVVDSCDISNAAFYQLARRFATVRARHMASLSNIRLDAGCAATAVYVDGTNLRRATITADSKVKTFSASKLGSESFTLVTSWLPANASYLTLDRTNHVTVVLDSPQLVQKWYSNFGTYYSKVNVQLSVAGTTMPVTSYADALQKHDFYTRVVQALGSDPLGTLATASTVNLSGKRVKQDVIDYVCENAKAMTVLNLSHNGTSEQNVVIKPTLAPLGTINLNNCDSLETANFDCFLTADADGQTYISMANCARLTSMGNAMQRATDVYLNDCPRLRKDVKIAATDPARVINICGTNIILVKLNKRMKSIIANRGMNADGVEFDCNYDDSEIVLTISPSSVLSVKLYSLEQVEYFFKRFPRSVQRTDRFSNQLEKAYPNVTVYLSYAGGWLEVTSLDDARSQMKEEDDLARSVLAAGPMDMDGIDISTLELIDLTGAKAQNDFFSYMANHMPRVHTIIAEKGGVGPAVKIPATQTPIRSLQLADNPSMYIVRLRGDVAANSNVNVSRTGVQDIDGLLHQFTTVTARGCQSLNPWLTIDSETRCRYLDISGSSVAEIELSGDLQTFRADSMKVDDQLVISCNWLPTAAFGYNFVARGNRNMVVRFTDRALLRSWFKNLAPIYPDATVQMQYDGEWFTVNNADDIELAPLSVKYPDLTSEQLAQMTEIDLRGVVLNQKLLDYIFGTAKNLAKVNANNADGLTTVNIERLTIPATATALKELDLTGWSTLKGITFGRSLGKDSRIDVSRSGITNLSDILMNVETVIANQCENIYSFEVPADATVKRLVLDGYKECRLDKAVHMTLSNAYYARLQLNALGTGSNNMIELVNVDDIEVIPGTVDVLKAWFNKYASLHPDARVVVQMSDEPNGNPTPITDLNMGVFVLDFLQKASTLTTLDVSGQKLSTYLVAQMMQKGKNITTLIARKGAFAEGETGLWLPSLNRAYKKIDLTGNSQLTDLWFDGYADPADSELILTGTQIQPQNDVWKFKTVTK